MSQYGTRFGTNIGLFSLNRPEWVIAEQACYMYGYVTVPLYDTLGSDAIEYILKLAEVPIVVATADKTTKLLQLASNLPKL
ncbi:Protein MICROTUBULE ORGANIZATION 1, partial [Kappamyces sp. JEL0680]